MAIRLGIVVAAAMMAASVASGQMAEPEPAAHTDGITAESWALAEFVSGRIIAERGLNDPRKAASTTKMMCAHVVLQLAKLDPRVLEERVTWSASAAATRGSSADLEEGDSVTVYDALYALMLPSGNDAGNALAEHFSPRVAEAAPGMGGATAARANFIGEMNRQAAGVGMAATTYRLAYGDGGTAADRTTSAADLLTLGRVAMRDPLFRKVVSTKSYTATVRRADGTTYQKTWTNTNSFLGEPGFEGIKTGTTTAAGACLVTAYHRDGVPVIVVVLGSKGSATRYADTRALLERHFPAAPASP